MKQRYITLRPTTAILITFITERKQCNMSRFLCLCIHDYFQFLRLLAVQFCKEEDKCVVKVLEILKHCKRVVVFYKKSWARLYCPILMSIKLMKYKIAVETCSLSPSTVYTAVDGIAEKY